MNNFFIEGPVRIGKSTILRRCLEDYKRILGGFSSQRILEKDTGHVLGYSLMPASDFCIEIHMDKSELHAKENLFLAQHGAAGGFVFSPEVFAGAGMRFLDNYQYCDLMLLDEIGGVELQVPSFKEKLYEVLAAPVPCIGVLKGSPNAASFKNKTVLSENDRLRAFLANDSNSEILSVNDFF